MKKTPFLLLILCGLSAMAAAQIDYHRADSFATNFKQKYQAIDDLAKQLTAPFSYRTRKGEGAVFLDCCEHPL
jgi:hypothetical protein